MKTPDISVIIPAYNAEKYIKEAILSVLSQNYTDFELIVVDDGSTDSTGEIVKSFGDSAVQYFYQKNASQGIARNKGIELSRGKFIAFLDADDIWEKDKLEKQIKLFSNPDVGLVYSPANLIDENSNMYGCKQQEFHRGRVIKQILHSNFIVCSSVLLRKQILLDNDLKFLACHNGAEDWDLWCRIAFYCKFDYCQDNLLLYREHSCGVSKNSHFMYPSHIRLCEDLQCDILRLKLFSETEEREFLKILRKGYYYCCLRYLHCFLADGDFKKARECMKKAFWGSLFNYHYWWGFLKLVIYSTKKYLKTNKLFSN